MKAKKQKINNHASNNKKKQNLIPDQISPLNKQFQLIYRTCDRLPTSEQYQSVFFMKRKKISEATGTTVQQKKSKKKKQTSKKKKSEEKPYIDQIFQSCSKKKQSLSVTKSSTMPATAFSLIKKPSFDETFKQKFDLQKTSLKKINNLNSSNSSRYLNSKYIHKQDKSPKKKLVCSPQKLNLKSPNKSAHKKIIQDSNKLSQQEKSLQNLKSIKSKRVILNKKNDKESCQKDEYVFLDGQYMQVDSSSLICQALTEKMISGRNLQSEKNCSNQFIQGFAKFKLTMEKQIPNKQVSESSQTLKKEEQQQQQQQELSQTQKKQLQQEVLFKIILIQRWWRAICQKRAIQECNNIKHFPSNASSQRQIHTTPENKTNVDINNHKQDTDNLEQQMMKNFISSRQKLILSNMQSQTQLLDKMLDLNKIDAFKYNQNLAQVHSNYQRQMLQINKLKKKIQIEAQKMNEIKIKIKQKSEIMSKIQKIPANIILQHFFDKKQQLEQQTQNSVEQKHFAHRQKSTGCHYSQMNDEKNQDSSKCVGYRKASSNQTQNSQKQIGQSLQNQDIKSKQKFQQSSSQNSQDQQNQNDGSNPQINNDQQDRLNQIISVSADRQYAQMEIQKRYASQLGLGFQYSGSKSSISTSVISIHNFLMNFLKFYEYFYKDEFLKLINLPYGYKQLARLKLAQNSQICSTQTKITQQNSEQFFKVESIIGDEIIQDFHEHHYQLAEDIDDSTKAAIYFEKVHQKAIIDCFNQSLNCFRPYYFINGPPYLWNYSQKALTFYYIAEQNIQQVFEKTQYKVLKNASCLCGTIVQTLITKPSIRNQMSLQQKFEKYRQSINIMLVQNREEKLSKVEKLEVEQNNFRWQSFQQQKTSMLLAVASAICQQLLIELVNIKPLGSKVEIFQSPQNINQYTSQKSINKQYQTQSSHQSSQNKSQQQSEHEKSIKQSYEELEEGNQNIVNPNAIPFSDNQSEREERASQQLQSRDSQAKIEDDSQKYVQNQYLHNQEQQEQQQQQQNQQQEQQEQQDQDQKQYLQQQQIYIKS